MGVQGLGERASPPAVADAGPLIHLSEIGQFHLLRVFGALHIPAQVIAEAIRHGPVTQEDLDGLGVVRQHNVTEESLQDIRTTPPFQKLHTGELACFFLCRDIGVKVILCDDLASRDAAADLGVTPVGSLGMVVRAFRRGLISRVAAERAIVDLYDVSTLFVTRALVDIALAELNRHSR